MSKIFKKLLIGGTAIAAVAAGIAYFYKKKHENSGSWNDDMEDFEDGLDQEKTEEPSEEPAAGTEDAKREYVTLHVEHKAETVPEEPSKEEESEEEPLDDDLDDRGRRQSVM